MSVMPRKPVERVTAATSFLLSATLSNRLEEEADDDCRPLPLPYQTLALFCFH